MPFLITFKTIHLYLQTKLYIMKGMTIKICRVNTRVETIYKALEKNRQRKYILTQGWIMSTKRKGKTLLDQIWKDCEEARQTHVPAIAHEHLLADMLSTVKNVKQLLPFPVQKKHFCV